MSRNRLRSAARTVRRAAEWPGEKLVEELRENRYVRRAVLTVAAVNALGLVGGVRAQTAVAGDFLCGTGAGKLVALGLGLAILALLGMTVFRGTLAWKNMGAARTDKKQEGREQLKGAGVTAIGMFVPALFGRALDHLGVGAFSCVDWGGLVGGGAAGYMAPVLVGLPF